MSMLEGLTVTEAGNDPGVRFCGWLFAMNGATVTRVASPLSNDDPWAEAFLDARKRIVREDAVTDWDVLEAADVVIAEPDHAWASITAPMTVTGTIDAFAVEGPYADWQGNELAFTTLSGATGYTVTREGVPVYGYGDRFQYLAGMYLYQALCSCLLQEHPATAAAPRVRVSNFESAVSLLPYLTTQYEYNRSVSTAEQSGPRFVSACTDGYVVTYAGFAWLPIATTLERLDLVDDPRFVDNSARFAHVAELGVLIDEWASTRTVEDACRAGQKQNVAVTAIRTPSAALADEALDRRGAWFTVPVDGRDGRIPALPYTVDGARPHLSEEVTA